MSAILTYYLTGGTLLLGKNEALFEMMRPDSILKTLLGYDGALKPPAQGARTAIRENRMLFDFSNMHERKLDGDPSALLSELKTRYGKSLGGMLYFRCAYSMGMQNLYFKADLEADDVALTP